MRNEDDDGCDSITIVCEEEERDTKKSSFPHEIQVNNNDDDSGLSYSKILGLHLVDNRTTQDLKKNLVEIKMNLHNNKKKKSLPLVQCFFIKDKF